MFSLVNKQEVEKLCQRIEVIEKQVNDLSQRLDSLRQSDTTKLCTRVEELELWRSNLHGKLISRSKLTGNETLTSFGRDLKRFYSGGA